MATRSSVAGGINSGDPVGASDPNSMPGGLIGYVVVTSNQSGITTLVDLTGLTLTVTPQANRIIKIEWMLNFQDDTAQGTTEAFRVVVQKDGSQFRIYDYVSNPGAATNIFTANGFTYDFAPTNASHTYNLGAIRSGSASGTFTLEASSSRAAILSLSDCGPSF